MNKRDLVVAAIAAGSVGLGVLVAPNNSKAPEAAPAVEEAQAAKVSAMAQPIVRIAVAYTNAPAYTNGQYYVWASEATATNALNAINDSGWFPITGRNAATGELAPDKAKTTMWTDAVLERLDGKFVFLRIPEATLDALNVPELERQTWWDGYLPAVEEYQDDWFPTE